MQLLGLGYVGLAVPDPKSWLAFATDVVGMMPARALPGESFGTPAVPDSGPASGGSGMADDGSVYLKMDDRQWRVALHRSDAPGLAYLGFEVGDGPALEAATRELQSRGTTVTGGSAQDAAARGVENLVWCTDPSGTRVELFHGGVTDFNFVSPLAATFVTGPLGAGHALLFVPDMVASLDFYVRVLGFRRSDYINVGPGMSAQFLRCTARHHSIGLVHVGQFSGVHHVMFEMTDVDGVGRALDRALAAGATITSTLGRHSNDQMLSFYVRSPGGFDVEIGCQGMLIDDSTWSEREFVEGDVWGHKGLTPEALEAAARG